MAQGTSTGKQTYETILPDDHPGKYPRPKVEAKEQASGKSMELQMGLMAPEWEMTALELEMETETR